jgi:segregation and condensation protein B
MEISRLKSVIESLLFLSGEPLKISKIAKICESSKAEVENAIMILQGEYSSAKRGIILIKKEDETQLSTNPENFSFIDRLVKSEMQEGLSKAALEVLSIIAYKGPISRAEIESIRGVNCSFTLRSLMMKGLLERIDNPKDGRGYLYKISFEFMKKLGIENIDKLPDYQELSQDPRIESVVG